MINLTVRKGLFVTFAQVQLLHVRTIRSNGQIERQELENTSLFIVNCISKQTRGKQGVFDHDTYVVSVCPYIRRIQYAERVDLAILGNNAQLIDDLTTRQRIDLILLGVGLCDRVFDRLTMPLDSLVLMEDAGLNDMPLRHFGDLVINDRVTNGARNRIVSRIAEDLTNRVEGLVEITLTVDERVFVLADGDPLGVLRCLLDGEGQAVDAIGAVDGLIAVLILLAFRQLVVHVIRRTVEPLEWQVTLADRRVQCVQIGWQNHENQLFLVRTPTC